MGNSSITETTGHIFPKRTIGVRCCQSPRSAADGTHLRMRNDAPPTLLSAKNIRGRVRRQLHKGRLNYTEGLSNSYARWEMETNDVMAEGGRARRLPAGRATGGGGHISEGRVCAGIYSVPDCGSK